MSEHEITGKSPARYFYMIPNIVAWMHLDPHTRALYDHYCWRINTSAKGSGYETTKTTAEFCHMSPAQVRESRNRLHNLGLIQVETRQTEQTHDGKPVFETSMIYLNDVMAISMAFENKEITLEQGIEQIRLLNADLLSRATPEELKVRGKDNPPMRIGDMPQGSTPMLQSRVGGMPHSSIPMPQGSTKQNGFKQQGFKEQEESPSPLFQPDQSHTQTVNYTTLGHDRPAKKTPNGSSAPTAITNTTPSDVYDTPDWLPKDLPLPTIPKPKKSDGIPAHWTAFHLAILRIWLNVSGKPFNTKIQQTEGIYAAWVDKTHLPALTPAIVADFRRWYYEQDSVIELAQKSNALAKHPSEAVNMPSEPDKVAKWINLYVADYQADLERRQANIWQGEQLRAAAKRAEQPLVLPLVLQGLQGRRGNQEGANSG